MTKSQKYTIVAGCGRLGAGIAGKLSDEKKDVLILDCDKDAFRKLPRSYGGWIMTGNTTDLDKMRAAGMDRADTFLAVTDYDCVNICAAQMAKTIFHIPRVVARIYDEEKIPLVQELGIDTICPSELSEKELAGYIMTGREKSCGTEKKRTKIY